VVLTDSWQDLVLKLAALWYWLTKTAGLCITQALSQLHTGVITTAQWRFKEDAHDQTMC